MSGLLVDARYAVRLMRRAPAFSAGVVAILSLGIGVTTALLSAFDQIVVRPLPYAEPARLAMIWEDFSAFGTPKTRVSPATYLDWTVRARSFEAFAALRGSVMNLSESGPPEEVAGYGVTASLFPLLGVVPLIGRTISQDEEPPGHQVVVLSYNLWQ